MQPTIISFINGQPSTSTELKQIHPKKQSIAEVFLGQPFRDDAFSCSALICNFLDAFYHQIVCMYGKYAKNEIMSSSFNGILTKKCTNRRVIEYFQRMRPTLRRWLLNQQIRTFSVVLLDPEEVIVAEFRVNFYEPKIGMKRIVYEMENELRTLNDQLCQSLMDIQNTQVLCILNNVSFEIHIHSNGEVDEPQTSMEHEWEYVKINPSTLGTLHSSSRQVSCSLSEMRFNYLRHEPIHPNDKFSQSPDPIVSGDPDIIILD